MRILVVEDEFYARKSLVDTILTFDPSFYIEEAEDGLEALEKVEHSRFELIIADIRMPVMDGMEMARKIRAEHPEILVAMLTGYAEFDYAITALRIGVCEFLLKPVENDRLYALLYGVRERYSHYGDKIVDKLNSYIYANITDKINIADICKNQLFLDPAYVSRHYKTVTGQTIADTVRQLKLERAKGLLEKSDCNIGEIAVQCGYQSGSAFIQSFEKQYGKTPAEYRKEIKRGFLSILDR